MVRKFDILGLGLNATDTLLSVADFPSAGGKVPFTQAAVAPGGQVAVACVVAARYGLRVSYAGSIGEDEAGAGQRRALAAEGIDLQQLRCVPGVGSQQAWIFVDCTGERTIVYHRPRELAYPPEAVDSAWIASGRILHLDGHDGAAAARAAELARAQGVTVVLDVHNVYPHQRVELDRLLHATNHLVCSASFPQKLLELTDRRAALEQLRERYGCEVAALTLGAEGALALDANGFHACPGFAVNVVDTTGAGDVFHGGYLVGLARGWELAERLEFSSALAALNCTAWGARGFIAPEAAVAAFRQSAPVGGGRRPGVF